MIAEPPDGTRLEFIHGTDRYALWRDDATSREAGWTHGDGGETWCLYPSSVPQTWASLQDEFGDSLTTATYLVPANSFAVLDLAIAEATDNTRNQPPYADRQAHSYLLGLTVARDLMHTEATR